MINPIFYIDEIERGGLVAALFVFIPLILFLCIFIPVHTYITKRNNWIIEHSYGIAKLKEINNKYKTFAMPRVVITHSYDNKKFYEDISAKDYLMYQLANNYQTLSKIADDAFIKDCGYGDYLSEIKSECKLNSFSLEIPYKNKLKIKEVERKLFKSLIKPKTKKFCAKVILKLISMNGEYVKSKQMSFDYETIVKFIKQLNAKNDDFYIYKRVWNSLCKVERGKVTNKIRFEIYKRDNYKCCRCGSKDNLEIDHVVPIAKGGKSEISNLQTLCHNCNVRKGVQAVRYVQKDKRNP